MRPEELVREYLSKRHVMQLATVDNDQPYVCSVYYVHDDKLNIYWASWPDRRHSQMITKNRNVGATIVIESDKTKPVCGIQILGQAELCEESRTIRPIAEAYAKKFKRDSEWVEKFSQLKTKHRLYKLAPISIDLFDEVNFESNPQKVNFKLTITS